MTLADIKTEVLLLCDTDSTNYTDADMLRRFNAAQESFGAAIIQAVGKRQFDDKNNTTLPIGTFDLTDGQAQYTITDDFLSVDQLSVLGTDGVWHVLQPIDPLEFNEDVSIEQKYKTAGLPSAYDQLEHTFILYPTPAAAFVVCGAATGGAKFRFRRTTYAVSSADWTAGTIVPGIATPWHITLAKMTALPYCKVYKQDRVASIMQDIATEMQDAKAFYSLRGNDQPRRLSPELHEMR